MPKPQKGEAKGHYISRCIHYIVHREGKSRKEAIGKCYGMYEQYNWKGKKK